MYNDNEYDNSKYVYHGNYDKNIKAIRGGGVITPSNPPNRTDTTVTINNTWGNNIKPVPPLYESVYYSDKILTDGYLNQNNYVEKNDYISDYYYPSQNFDKVINLGDNNNLKKKYLNNINPIKFPPPLITSKSRKKKKSLFNKTKSNDDNIKTKKDDTLDLNDNLNENTNINDNHKLKNLTDEEIELIKFINNNALYDGKYYYTIENDNFQPPENSISDIIIPYTAIIQDKFNKNNVPKQFHEPIQIEDIENFGYNKNTAIYNSESTNNNVVLLIFFSILILIYFSIYQK